VQPVEIVSMIKKRRRDFKDLKAITTGIRAKNPPRFFKSINIEYQIYSSDLTNEEAQRFISLSIEKYCSVGATLRNDTIINHTFKIIRNQKKLSMKKIFTTIIIIQLISCASPVKNNESIIIFEDSILNIIDRTAEIEYIVDSVTVAEGPLWDSKSSSLLFTQVPMNKIYKWNEKEGYQTYISPSGFTNFAPVIDGIGLSGANGLSFDKNGDLIIAQHGDRRLARLKNSATDDPDFETIIDKYDGKRFNSPNDIAIASNGSIYFTDPTYGFMNLSDWSFDESVKELDFSGIYKFSDESGIELISTELSLPNGIALSNNERYLYVNSSNTTENPVVLRYDLENDNKSELFFDGTELAKANPGNFDGLKIHSSGNIFTTGPNGILVLSNDGRLLANIKFKDMLTNCAFDSDENYLYVTGFSFVARIALKK
jgi:gluconolactonase